MDKVILPDGMAFQAKRFVWTPSRRGSPAPSLAPRELVKPVGLLTSPILPSTSLAEGLRCGNYSTAIAFRSSGKLSRKIADLLTWVSETGSKRTDSAGDEHPIIQVSVL